MRWRFTDRALFFEPWEGIMTVKAGSLEEYSLLERWGEPGQAPPALLLESCVHAAHWLVEASSSFTLSCDLLAIDYWRSMEGLRPGERYCVLLLAVERRESQMTLAAHHWRVKPGGELPDAGIRPDRTEAAGLFSVAFAPLEERHIPEDRACLWRELRP